MKRVAGKNLSRKLTISEIVFVVIVTVLASFITLEIIFQNFADELNLSPSLGGGIRTSGGLQGGIGNGPMIPESPQNVVASVGEPQVEVSWDAVRGVVDTYNIYRGGNLVGIVDSSRLSWKDDYLPMGASGNYKVAAVNAAGESAPSANALGSVSFLEGLLFAHRMDAISRPKAVSIGDSGSKLFSHHGAFNLHSMIFSSSGSSVPLLDYVHLPDETTLVYRSASAKNADVHVSMSGRESNGQYEISLKGFSSAGLIQDLEFEVFTSCASWDACKVSNVLVSDDGTKIFAFSYNSDSKILSWMQIDVATRAIISENERILPASINFAQNDEEANIRISEDFSTAVIKSESRLQVINLDTNELIYAENNMDSNYYGALDISSDGSRFAFGGKRFSENKGKVWVYEKQGNTYVEIWEFEYPLNSFNPYRLDLSSDGTFVAVGYSYISYPSFGIKAYDLTTGESTMDYRDLDNPAYYPNNPKRVRLSEDGTSFAVGFWGDDLGISDEILVFLRDQSEPKTRISTSGSVTDLEFSPDGTRIIASVRKGHVTWWLGGGTTEPEGGELAVFQIA